jgi:hypothetical protein
MKFKLRFSRSNLDNKTRLIFSISIQIHIKFLKYVHHWFQTIHNNSGEKLKA